MRPERVVLGSRLAVTGVIWVWIGWSSQCLLSWSGASVKYAGLRRSVKTVIFRPLTIMWNVLSDLAMTLCGPLYGGSRERRIAS